MWKAVQASGETLEEQETLNPCNSFPCMDVAYHKHHGAWK